MAVWVHVLFTFNVYIRFCFLYTSSRPEVFCKKGVLRNFAKFTGKHLCQGLFFINVAGPCNFFKKETLAQVFFSEFWKISKNTFSYRTHPAAASVYIMKVFSMRLSQFTMTQNMMWYVDINQFVIFNP